MPEIDPQIPSNAVSVYDNGGMEDFPVLKAFQQYIDAEQAKARKRLLTLGIFFTVIMFAVVGIFVVLLMRVSNRNQELNDRLVEFAMKDRDRASAVVVQPPAPQQDNSILNSLSAKLEEMQKKLFEESRRAEDAEKARKEAAEKAAREAAEKAAKEAAAAKPQGPSQAELELIELKAQLKVEREKSAELKAKQREAELEAYRRQHYPELYAPRKPVKKPVIRESDDEDLDEDAEYEEEEEVVKPKSRSKAKGKTPSTKSTTKPAKSRNDEVDDILRELDDGKAKTYFDEDDKYTIPVDIKGKKAKWRIPEE